MAQINYDLDLRSSECRHRTKILKPKTLRILLYLLTLVLMIIFCLMLDGYRLKLQEENKMLKYELAAKIEDVVPLIAISTELETYKRRSIIEETLLSGCLIKGEYLEIIEKSAPPALGIDSLAIDVDGMVEIRGSGTTLQSAAFYARKLQELPFIGSAELTAADLNEESRCYFSIKADLKQPAGGAEIDQ